ncbi:MAG: UDP-N-acetylmuramoyl-L-alanyl-D-glutamate--2,6-diaminopimelate ligase [Deltaproteobacteria bacterium]|nr:MAG: UDP-N-acetylmuramoyl-L-alanyl-D-glutamate--2,6-diaminopimelate ligase [Deltaproteobacteria bacterium]
MHLKELIQDLAIHQLEGETERKVSALTYHSANVVEGSIFVAIKGTRFDGHEFVRQAIDRGATCVVVEKPLESVQGATVIQVNNTRAALAHLASRFYGRPSQKLTVIGITGTNGKTTTTYLLESILAACGHRVGVIGTVNVRYPGHVETATVTTPESLDLQRTLREMLDAGVTHVVLEVTSHALDLHRVDGTRFAVGLFTNLSQDHLDFHGSMQHYFAAKSRLFSRILRRPEDSPALAVINGDDSWCRQLLPKINGPVLSYGLAPDAQIRARKVKCDSTGISALLHTPSGEIQLHSPLLGRLNLYNLLSATAVAVGLGLPLEQIGAGQQSLSRVPGRLESVPSDLGFQVLVDYAHTPDALEKALDSLRELNFQRIICVFGCGGDRDRSKRPLMGKAAAERADCVVITSDNPRSEAPEAIMADIEAGIRPLGFPRLSSLGECAGNHQRGYVLMADRGQAIRLAIECALPGDLVYIGGKGHEDYQILADNRIDFDDRVIAAQALAERKERAQ